MNFARKTDKVFTIIYTIISILSIIILIMTHIYPDKFFNNLYESFLQLITRHLVLTIYSI